MSTASKIAEYLLEINAIQLSPDKPFTWASGWLSPIYSDNRLALSYPGIRSFIKENLAEVIRKKHPHTQAIVGVATAGIAPGVLVADYLQLPFGYVRSEAKKHGMGKQIEGAIKPGQKVLVIEDLVSTGKSSLQAVHTLREFGCDVQGMASIFTYGFDAAQQAFDEAGCSYFSLSNYDTLITVAVEKGLINANQMDMLASWRRAPEIWGK